MAVRIGLILILLLTVAITIAPQVVMTGIAVVADSARDFALTYRSAASLVGLVAVAATSICMWIVFRPRRAAMETMNLPDREEPNTARVSEEVHESDAQRVA
jgi:hypothetical protein